MNTKLYVPPGTTVTMIGSRVTMDFFCEQDAEQFCNWLLWLENRAKEGKETEFVSRPTEVKQ